MPFFKSALLVLALPVSAAMAQSAPDGNDHSALREPVLNVLEQQFGALVAATQTMEDTARLYCAADAGQTMGATTGTTTGTTEGTTTETLTDAPTEADLMAAVSTTWQAWAALDAYQFGPIEQRGAALTIDFWPDKKGFVGRGLKALLARPSAEQADPAVVAAGSAAAQGLPALEMLLTSDLPDCPAVVGISANLETLSQQLYDDWFQPGGWADLVRDAGPDNPVYLSDQEFIKTIFTALNFGLTRVSDARIGRPLGTFERSFPKRAEAWRSDLTETIISAQLDGIATMLRDGLGSGVNPQSLALTLDAFDATQAYLADLPAPIPALVAEPGPRLKVEILQNKTGYLLELMALDIGPSLGVELGFSAGDGD